MHIKIRYAIIMSDVSRISNYFGQTSNENSQNIEKRSRFIRSKLEKMSEEQLTRFEFFMRSHFQRSHIKDILTKSISCQENRHLVITDEMAIVVSSLAKLYVGELVETAMCEIRGNTENPKITTELISNAYKRLQREGKVSTHNDTDFMLCSTRPPCQSLIDEIGPLTFEHNIQSGGSAPIVTENSNRRSGIR